MIAWDLHRTVEPTGELVTIDEAKLHFRVTHDDEDSYIEALVAGATSQVEEELSAALLAQTWVLRLGDWPTCEAKLPRPPLVSVTSVEYYDANDALQTLSTSVYGTDGPPTNSRWKATPSRIYLKEDQAWPTLGTAQPWPVIVTYQAGASTPQAVPELVRLAVKMVANDAYMHREPTTTDGSVTSIPIYDRLIASHRCVWEPRYA